MTFPFNRPQWLGLVREAPIPTGYIGERWFPFADVASDELIVNVKLSRNPLAPYVALDAEIPLIPKDIYKEIHTHIAYIRYKHVFSEKDLRIFNEIGVGEASLIAQGQRQRREEIENMAITLSQSVDGTIEKQRMDVLFKGQIDNTWETDRKALISIVFPGVTAWTVSNLTSSKYWDQSGSDPIKDLKKAIKTVQDKSHVRPRAMILSTDILWTLAENANFVALWNATRSGVGTAASITPVQASAFLAEALSLEVIEYGAQYTKHVYDPTSAEPRVELYDMVDAKNIALLPAEPLGTTATSPDEENAWQSGRYSWGPIRSLTPPRTYEVGAGQNCLVRCDFPDRILYARVLNTEVA